MRDLIYMASRDKVDVDMFHKGIQYALEELGKSKFGLESTTVSNFKIKRHEGFGNELVDYSRAPCLGADQKARGLWKRDWLPPFRANILKFSRLVNIFSNNLLYSTLAFLTTTRMPVRGSKHLDRKKKAAIAVEV